MTKEQLADAFDKWLDLYRLNPAEFLPVAEGEITIGYGNRCASFIWSLAGLDNEPGAVKA